MTTLNQPSLQLKKINDYEKKWKDNFIQMKEKLNQKFSRLNDEIQKIMKNLMIITFESLIEEPFQDIFDQFIPQLKKVVSYKNELNNKEKELENMKTELKFNKELFEKEKKKYEEMFHLPSDIVELNVGGKYFCTLRSTLTNVVPDSMLSSMFSGRWPITCDINGHFFIDRDPNLFNLVLNGLRNNGYWNEPFDPNEKKTLLIELDYFCLKMFIDQYDVHQYHRIYIFGGSSSTGNHKQFGYLELQSNKWISAGEIFIQRTGCTAVSTKDRIYLIGGNGLNSVEYYDPKMNQWYNIQPMSNIRWRAAAVYHNNNIFVMGGEYSGNYHKSVECYNIENDIWTMLSPMNIARSGFSATILNDEIYVMGGISSNSLKPNNSAEKYNPINDQWKYIAPMQTARRLFAAVTIQCYIYALGGSDGNKRLDSVECYKLEMNSWKYITSMPRARECFASVSVNNKIYVFGGWGWGKSKNKELQYVDRYDPKSRQWDSNLAKLKQNRYDFSAVCF